MLNEHETDRTIETPAGSPEPNPPPLMNSLVFDLAAIEQKLIASYQETIKMEVSNALKPLQESIDVLLASKKKMEEIHGEVKKLKHENKAITCQCNVMERENKVLKDRINDIENKLLCGYAWCGRKF